MDDSLLVVSHLIQKSRNWNICSHYDDLTVKSAFLNYISQHNVIYFKAKTILLLWCACKMVGKMIKRKVMAIAVWWKMNNLIIFMVWINNALHLLKHIAWRHLDNQWHKTETVFTQAHSLSWSFWGGPLTPLIYVKCISKKFQNAWLIKSVLVVRIWSLLTYVPYVTVFKYFPSKCLGILRKA